ncbi:MAG: prolipoprotein diacylglyceryl transferase [Prevotellaceae bacterium]|jgi:prolipoprotein diacylglyceryl transferase|nr:prolipoprotein diacylglyceryl transferase [Prevotellaceae bacterium]
MIKFLSIRWNVDPVIFHIGSTEIRYYSLIFVAAFILGMYIFANMLKRENKDPKLLEKAFYTIFFSTLIGARLGHCLFYEGAYFIAHPIEIFWPIKDGKWIGYHGLASHGAAIGILIGLYIYSRKNKLSYLWTLDRIVITVALAGFFIRMGNLMNSEIYGHETNLPWGFIFARAGETATKHPTQLYEALSYLAIFVILYFMYFKLKSGTPNGVIFGVFLILLFTTRLLIEFIKEPQVDNEYIWGLNIGQRLSIPFIIAGFIVLWYVYWKKKKDADKIANTQKVTGKK